MAIPGQYIIPATPKRAHQYQEIAEVEFVCLLFWSAAARGSELGAELVGVQRTGPLIKFSME